MSQIKKILKAVVFGRGLMAARQLIIIPILLKQWGTDYYGNWLILSAIPSFLSMSNLGLGTSAATQIATRPYDEQTLAANATTLRTTWIMISVIFTVVASALIIWNYYNNSSFSKIPDGFLILLALVATLFIRMYAQPLHGWWVSSGKTSKSLNSNNVYAIGDLLINLFVPILGGWALTLTISGLIWAIAWLFYYIYLSSREGAKSLLIGNFSLCEAKKLTSIGIGHQLSPLWQGLLFQGTIMLAGSLLGPAGAALWGSLRVINRVGNQVLELVSQTAGPEFQRNHAQRNDKLNSVLHTQSLFASILISTTMATGLICFGNTIFSIWTHNSFHYPNLVWVLLPLSLIPFSLWWISGEYQRSTNRPWGVNLCGLIAAISSLLITYILKDQKIMALVIGSLSFEIIMAFFVLPRTLKLLNESYANFFNGLIKAPLLLLQSTKTHF